MDVATSFGRIEFLRRQRAFVDVELQTVDGCVAAHRVVLAAHSSFFEAAFSSEWHGSAEGASVQLHHLRHETVLTIVEAMYTAHLDIRPDNALNVFAAANELDVPTVAHAASEFLASRLDAGNACQILDAACRQQCAGLRSHASTCIVTQLAAATCPSTLVADVYDLDAQALECILQANSSTVSVRVGHHLCTHDRAAFDLYTCALLRHMVLQQEVDLFVLLLGWLARDMPKRACELPTLLRCICPSTELGRLVSLAQDAPAVQQASMQLSSTALQQERDPKSARNALLATASGPAHADAMQARVDRTETLSESPHSMEDDDSFMSCGGHAGEAGRCMRSLVPGKSACDSAVDELLRWPEATAAPDSAVLAQPTSNAISALASALTAFQRIHAQHRPGRGHSAESNPQCRKSAVCSGTAPQPRRPWAAAQLFACGGRDSGWRGLAATATYDAAADAWAECRRLPKHESYAQAVGIDGVAFALGNTMAPCRLDLTAGEQKPRWRGTQLSGWPSGLLCTEAVALGWEMWVLGGRMLPNTVCSGCSCYDARSDAWCPGPALHTARYSAAACALGPQLFICGGQDNANVLADVDALDTERGWVPQASLVTARKYHASACVHRRIYCLGGKDASNLRLDTVEAFDAREGRWRVLGSMPEARSSFGCTQLAGQIYIAGGNDAAGVSQSSVLCFCPLMQQWRTCASLPWRCNSLGLCTV